MSGTIWDVVVVGAGVAGLAAARTALELGLTRVALEAKDRIGGRAWTDTENLGVPWERGANWLHNAEGNFFTRYAEAQGFACEPIRAPARRLWADGWAAAACADLGQKSGSCQTTIHGASASLEPLTRAARLQKRVCGEPLVLDACPVDASANRPPISLYHGLASTFR